MIGIGYGGGLAVFSANTCRSINTTIKKNVNLITNY